MCVLQYKVDSTILVLKLFTNFTEGADSMKQVGMISVNRCAEIRNASLMAQPIMAETGRRVLESDAFSAGLSIGWVKLDWLWAFPSGQREKWRVEREAQTGMCWWLTCTFKTSCGCTALDMPEWRKTTEQIEKQAKQHSQVACFSEDLKRWEAWDITCGHKAKDITQSITWRREVCKEEALDNPWKNKRGPSSVRQTLEPFQRQCWRNFWEMGWRTYGLFWAHRYHLELNWTENEDCALKFQWETIKQHACCFSACW